MIVCATFTLAFCRAWCLCAVFVLCLGPMRHSGCFLAGTLSEFKRSDELFCAGAALPSFLPPIHCRLYLLCCCSAMTVSAVVWRVKEGRAQYGSTDTDTMMPRRYGRSTITYKVRAMLTETTLTRGARKTVRRINYGSRLSPGGVSASVVCIAPIISCRDSSVCCACAYSAPLP